MKKIFTSTFLLLAIACLCINYAKAQDIANDPGAYMNAIGTAENGMNKAYMAYISASAHSSRKRKIDKMRTQAVESIANCQNTLVYLPQFKNDNSLRQASISYIQLCYKVFNEDYAHIVNMDDIAERSYDEMQAYLLLTQATNDTLQVAIARMNKAQEKFAGKYGVNLTAQKTELSDKMKESNRVSEYRNKVFLLFYKCNWEDNQLVNAVNQKNVTKIEQMRSALDKFAKEGLATLDTLQGFNNDRNLAESCKQALTFYKDEAEVATPKVTDFFLKSESFNKLKEAMDAKGVQRTKEDVDSFNKGVGEMNSAANAYNQTNNELNASRTRINNGWMEAEKAFTDAHTPYYN